MQNHAADTHLELCEGSIKIASLYDWATDDAAGAIVLFSGTTRNHAPGREGVERLEYEAYEEQVIARLQEISDEMRKRYPEVIRVGIVHRTGIVQLKESSVVVVVSSPHRPDAFAGARFGIDALKKSVPIWKRETWAGGEDWSSAASDITDAELVDGDGMDPKL